MNQLLENLNTEQLQAVTHVEGPLLIVAGAGTGKTTVITRRIAYLIGQKLAKPDEILALTFTDKAATEMEERVDKLMPMGSFDAWISTFHSFCERLLKQHGLDIGLPNDFKLLDDVGQWILIYKNFDKFKLNYYRPLGSPNKFIDALLDHFSKCKDEIISPSDYLTYAEGLRLSLDNPDFVSSPRKRGSRENEIDSRLRRNDIGTESDQISEIKRAQEIAGAYHTYQKLLLDNGSLDFGDLINYTLELLRKRPDILKFYQEKFKFILLDEFQDTNYAQYELIKMLAGNAASVIPTPSTSLRVNYVEGSLSSKKRDSSAPAGASARNDNNHRHNLVVVGDDDQSIYKFRGASVSNILKFKEDFKTFKQITLVENYRSSKEILDLAYKFIQNNNPNRLETKLNIDKRLHSNTKQKSEVLVLEGKDLSQEIDLIIKKILGLKHEHSETTWNDFAILIRANSAAEEILPKLDSANIPYQYLANKGLYKKPLISDLIAYLKLLDNYHESASLYRIMQFPKFQISSEELAHLTQFTHKKTISLYEALTNPEALLKLSASSIKKLDQLLLLISKHSEEASKQTAVELFIGIVADLGLKDFLTADTWEAAQNRELVEQFYKHVEEFEVGAENKTLRGFVEHLNLEMKAGNEGAIKFDPNLGPESLKLLTIHSAKGLEFQFVFIVNLVDQRFPTRARGEAIALPLQLIKDILPEGDFHLQEERRLFYVALTRAKTHLYLSWAKDYGGAKLKKPSLFLTETGLVPSEKINLATGKVVFDKTKDKPKKQLYKTLPKSFSYTDLETFSRCPLQYKYRSYLKLPLPGTAYQSFGISIHKTLQKFMEEYKNKQSLPQQDLFNKNSVITLPEFTRLEEIYQANWIDEWYTDKKQKQEYFELGKKLLKTFYGDTKNTLPKPKYIEKFFRMTLGKYEFVGKIDRADETGEGLIILDYKTGKLPQKGSGNLDQLRIYQWAVEEDFQEKVNMLCYWYLESNQKIEEAKASRQELKNLQAKLSEKIELIVHTIKYNLFEEEHKKAKQHFCNFAELS